MEKCSLSTVQAWDKAHKKVHIPKNIIFTAFAPISKTEASELDLQEGSYSDVYFNITKGLCSRNFIGNLKTSNPKMFGVITKKEYENKEFVLLNASSNDASYYIWTEYIDEIKAIQISFFHINSVFAKVAAQTREITESARFYLTRDKVLYAREQEDVWFSLPSKKRVKKISSGLKRCEDLSHLIYWIKYNWEGNSNRLFSDKSKSVFREQFKLCFGPAFWIGMKEFFFTDVKEDILDFLKYKEPTPKNGGRSKVIRKLVDEYSLTKKEATHDGSYKYVFIEKLDDSLVVARGLINSPYHSHYMIEDQRIYFYNNDVYPCRVNNKGEWVLIPLSSMSFWDRDIPDYDGDVAKGTKIEHIAKKIANRCRPCDRGPILLASLRYPWFFKLVNANKTEIAKGILGRHQDEVEKEFQHDFACPPVVCGSVRGMLGMNKHQIDVISRFFSVRTRKNLGEESQIVSLIKSALNDFSLKYVKGGEVSLPSIQDVDNQTFDIVFNAIATCFDDVGCPSQQWEDMSEIVFLLRKLYGWKTARKALNMLIPVRRKNIEALVVYPLKSSMAYSKKRIVLDFYLEYLRMVYAIAIPFRFRPYFDVNNLETLVSMHDDAFAYYNGALFDTVDCSLFSSHELNYDLVGCKGVERYLYENDKFVVTAPTCTADAIEEGFRLHNFARKCRKNLCEGISRIVYIRRQDMPDEPYYVAEIKDSSIVRIAGYFDYVPTANVRLLEFIDEWRNIKGLSLKTENKYLSKIFK